MNVTDLCARCGGDCPMTSCPECGGCENTGTRPCPACQPQPAGQEMPRCGICADPKLCECGSPNCARCRTCGQCVASVCECPVEVQLADGGTLTLDGAS